MKKTVLAASLALLTSIPAQADTLLGLYIGGQMWANNAKGSFGEGEIDQSVFNFEDEYQGSFYVAFEHPIPLIPNAKIASTTLDTVGGTTLTSSFTFNGQTYTANTDLDTTLEASYIDYTLYYELFDNDLLTFDFGITGRDLDSYIHVIEPATKIDSDLSASGIIPMVYLSTIVGLPFTGFNFFAEGNFISYDDQTVYDVQAGVSYELLDNLAVDLDLTLGYRTVKLELNDLDDFYSDLTFDGVFVGAILHF
ncbi:TIGR04219 family outer membrane beta-barrel protein [Litorilituus sediminis]|uniref:TIGR04219 family outer membrane beta-barrel protein n=2 Tax=Litorilituus sediminis TaxID=718192 RepID=A0A4P6PDI2_9GAMM|nr:TIGR04219 family outer membrane beta-barrel protein [Litorilituus sediminis]